MLHLIILRYIFICLLNLNKCSKRIQVGVSMIFFGEINVFSLKKTSNIDKNRLAARRIFLKHIWDSQIVHYNKIQFNPSYFKKTKECTFEN